uniref:Uncharacterized protein n=1 Tax=Arundo donax TaxID=35708 RepID=A0A0A9GAM9_ARUDO
MHPRCDGKTRCLG